MALDRRTRAEMRVPSFTRFLGARVESADRGNAVVTLELHPHHLNRRGVVHGGVIASLLDTALGAAVISSIPKEWWCATTSLSVQFLEGARGGTLTATARLERRGGRVAFARGEIRDGSGRAVAVAHGTWHLWPYRPGEAAGGEAEPYVVMRGTGERIRVGKIVCVGRNYADHVAEMGGKKAGPPVVFLKPSTAIVHDGGTVRIPPGAGEVHHEVEMVAVIGARCQAVRSEDALDRVLGFAVGLDMTLREEQRRAKERGEPWTFAKGFDTSAPVSLVAPREEVGDGSGLALMLDRNGERRQEGNTGSMIHTVADLVATISERMTLERGDLLFTGTPAGVGPVAPGDRIEARLEKVGTLRVKVAGMATASSPGVARGRRATQLSRGARPRAGARKRS